MKVYEALNLTMIYVNDITEGWSMAIVSDAAKACAVCNSDKNVVVHHDSYYPEHTRLLCRSCHKKYHDTHGCQHENSKLMNQRRKNKHRLFFSTVIERMTRLVEIIVYDPVHGSFTYSDYLEVRKR